MTGLLLHNAIVEIKTSKLFPPLPIEFDVTGLIPGYLQDGDEKDIQSGILQFIDRSLTASKRPFSILIDSVDTIAKDLKSQTLVLASLKILLQKIREHSKESRLILPIHSSSSLLLHLLPTTFSPALTHLRFHPPEVLPHLLEVYLLPPPPISNPQKFWTVFSPFTSRERAEATSLVFSPNSIPIGSDEIVVEVTIRPQGIRKGVEHSLEGWKDGYGPCKLSDLPSLAKCFEGGNQAVTQEANAPDPTQSLSFNLNLTLEQQAARAQVPLPYAHEGETKTGTSSGPTIYYDPDSADDMDDEDPDEDLDL